MKNTKNIINVTVNGLNAKKVISMVQERMDTVQKSAFNLAVLGAYCIGVTIPSYTDNKGGLHGEATIEKKMERKEFYTQVNRSKSTLSRWVGALELIIEHGDFTLFNEGVLPFNYDKIFVIYKNLDKFEGYNRLELFDMSLNSLKALLEEEKKEEEEKTIYTETNDEEEKVRFVIEGVTYETTKSNLTNFLKSCDMVD